MGYAIEHEGKAYTTEGLKPIGNVPDHNSQVEQQEIAWLKTAPDKCFLYVKMPAPQWQVVNSSCHVAGSFATRQQAEEFKTSLKLPLMADGRLASFNSYRAQRYKLSWAPTLRPTWLSARRCTVGSVLTLTDEV